MKFASYLQAIQGVVYCFAQGGKMSNVMSNVCLDMSSVDTGHTTIHRRVVGCVVTCLQSTPAPQKLTVFDCATDAAPGGYRTRIQESRLLKFASVVGNSGIRITERNFLKKYKKNLAFLFWFWYVQGGKSTQKEETSKTSKTPGQRCRLSGTKTKDN